MFTCLGLKTNNYQHRIHSCRSDHNQTPDSAWKWCCVVFAVVLYKINIGAYAANLLCFYWLTEPEVEQKIVCQSLLEIAPKQEKTRLLLVQASTGVNTRFCQHIHTIKKQQDIKFSEIEKLLADLIEGRIWHFQQQQQHVCLINQQKKEQKGTDTNSYSSK